MPERRGESQLETAGVVIVDLVDMPDTDSTREAELFARSLWMHELSPHSGKISTGKMPIVDPNVGYFSEKSCNPLFTNNYYSNLSIYCKNDNETETTAMIRGYAKSVTVLALPSTTTC